MAANGDQKYSMEAKCENPRDSKAKPINVVIIGSSVFRIQILFTHEEHKQDSQANSLGNVEPKDETRSEFKKIQKL